MKRFAPAKINLSLEIVGKREDGFHNLRSLFLPISLVDELTFTPAETFAFTCSDATVPADDTNLVVRAAKLFGNSTLPDCAIHLRKNIPHSAGLGGGSSDAATTLLTLNEMVQTPRSFAELEIMAAQLGSDVPFFLHRSAAWCEGRGEIVQPVEMPGDFQIVLFKPPFGVPTPWAFQNLANSLPLPGVPTEKQETPWGMLVNDLERPVFGKFLVLALVKQFLLTQSETVGALMSGSGSTVFALTASQKNAEVLCQKLEVEFGTLNWTAIAQQWKPKE